MNWNARRIYQLFTAKFFLSISLLLWGASAFPQSQGVPSSACGPLRPPGQYGPFDYRTDQDKLPIV